jgi:hypothetical protein
MSADASGARHSLNHLSIRIKLTLIMMATSSVGLSITATTFIVREGPIDSRGCVSAPR